jgi:hypothetical protein
MEGWCDKRRQDYPDQMHDLSVSRLRNTYIVFSQMCGSCAHIHHLFPTRNDQSVIKTLQAAF